MAFSIVLLLAGSSFAQSGGTFEIRRSQFTGGGGTSSGGTFAVFGTAGQHDAGDLIGGTFLLRGGFIQAASGGMSCVNDFPDCDDMEVCTFDECDAGACSNTSNTYGDLNHDGVINVFDLFCVLNGFGGQFAGNCTLERVDIDPCDPNGIINIFDLFAVLNAFGGGDPCCSGLAAPTYAPAQEISRTGTIMAPNTVISLVPSQQTVRRGELVSVDILVTGAADLRGYQVAVETLSGRYGRLELESITVDAARRDYVFGGLESIDATDQEGSRVLGALLDGGVSSGRGAYLATYTFRASRNARGTFRIALRPDETVLLDSAGQRIESRTAPSTIVSVR